MVDDDLGDWRIAVVTRLAADIPPAYPGGPSHKAGASVYLSSIARHREFNTVSFVHPSPSALALNIAHKCAQEAKKLRSTLVLQDVVTPYGKGKAVANENLPHLYDFFEHCMAAATFAFQAIEVFANDVIGRKVEKPFLVKSRGKSVSPQDAQRKLTIDDKLSQVLPEVLGLPTPKGTEVWEGYVTLKRVRDSAVHLKSHDAYTGHEIDRESLFYQFLNTDPVQYPRLAHDMIRYFLQAEGEPRWSKKFREIIAR